MNDPMPEPHFKIPLNLPHAAKVATRIIHHLERDPAKCRRAMEKAQDLARLLDPYLIGGENPDAPEAENMRRASSEILRALVNEIEAAHMGSDRLGQAIRNVFECLELGEEGARESLRAGENPDSALRAK